MSYRDRDSRDSRSSGTRVYVGDLPNDARKEELEEEFGHFGRLSSVWVARNPPGFAFIEFEDSKDAEDAVADLDGRKVCGGNVKVEIASGRRRGGGGRGGGGGFRGGGRSFGGGGGGGGFRDRSNDKCYSCGESGHFARDCRSGGGGGGGGGRSYGGGGGRSYGGGGGGRSYNRRSRSRSRSPESPRRQRRDTRSKSRSPKE